MPPFTQPQAPKWPSTSPIQWCIRTYAEPGVIGPHHAPMIACVASAPFTRSSSNHSSRKSAALIVNSRTSSWMSRPVQPRNRAGRLRPSRDLGQPHVRRHDEQQILQELGDALEVGVERDPRLGVVRRQPSDVLRVARHVAPERERGPVGERHEVVRRDDRDLVAVALQLELVDDPLRHQRHDVGRAGDLVAGPRLLRDGRAAQDVTPFEDQDVEPGTREVRGTREAVVAPADDHDVAFGEPHGGRAYRA